MKFQLKVVVFVFRCAFMEFTNVEDAIEVLKNVNKTEVEGKSIAQCHKESSQSKKKMMEEGEKWTSS